jgi:hypothetical protein
MTVQLTYFSSAYNGQSEQISAVTTATASVRIVRFSIDIFAYADGRSVKLASQTIVANANVNPGNSWRTLLAVTIPTRAQSGPLTGTVTEVWQQPSNYYSSSYGTPYYCTPYTQNYKYYNPSYNPNYDPQYNPSYNQCYNPNYNLNYNSNYYNPNYNPNYNTLQYVQYPNGFVALVTSPQSNVRPIVYRPTYVHQTPYTSQPAPYYVSNYITQVTSQQTFTLTYVYYSP